MNSRFLFFCLLLNANAPLFGQVCQYLAYEAFDYDTGIPMHGLNGGSGWQTGWEVQNNDTAIPGYQVSSIGGSMSYSNLQTSGNKAVGGSGYLLFGRQLNSQDGGPFDDYVAPGDEGIGTQTGDTLWLSAMIEKKLNNSDNVFMGLHGGNIAWWNGGSPYIAEFGYFDGHSTVGGQRRWTLRLGSSYYPTSVQMVPGEAVFFVMGIRFQPGNTAVDLYVNPNSLGNNTPVPTMTVNANAAFVFYNFAGYLGDSSGQGSIDELRLSASYTCSAPNNTVTFDLPPVAAISATPLSGTAPFQVTLSADASFDPEGQPLTYTWNFGDGSPQGTGVTQIHTYSALGLIPVTVTVEDPGGQQASASQTITVRNANGTFPCLSSFTLLQQPTCINGTGRIRINNEPPNFSLRNAAGTLLSTVNGNEYHHLPPGAYQYTAESTEGCRDSFQLQIQVDSSTCPGWQPNECRLDIGTNLSGLADWSPERPLRNLLKHVRSDYIAFDDPCYCWDNGNAAGLAMDAYGYPLYIPQVFNGVSNKVRYVISTGAANLPTGQQYLLLYDGEGTLDIGGGVTVISNQPGRVQFQVDGNGNIWMSIVESQQGNHVRNIRLLRLADEFVNLEQQPFYQGFLEKIAPFSTLRFMDWGATNGNGVEHWAERSSVAYFTYSTQRGVPYEIMIKLANATKKDVWICVPHAADSLYMASMAALFRDSLHPSLQVFLEYSNEVWNWIFAQANYNAESAPANLNYGRAYAEKAGKAFRIWHQVFGTQSGRVKRVLGLQAGFNYLNEQILSQLQPNEWDYASPSSYLGLNHEPSGNPVLNAGSTVQNIIQNARNEWSSFRPALKQDYRNIRLFGKEVVNYEGGQHFVGNVFGIPYPYQQAMWDAQESQEIYALYNDMLDTLRRWDSRLFVNFSLAGERESIYGSWGVVEDIDVQPPYLTTAPKYQALLDNVSVADLDFDGFDGLYGSCPGIATLLLDCDDHDPAVHPAAAEICGNNLDDNCNGLVDAADPVVTPSVNIFSGTDMQWQSAANWSTGFAPAACHDVVIPPARSVELSASPTAERCRTLDVASGALLTVPVGASLQVGDN
jgi:PKD repeat protein